MLSVTIEIIYIYILISEEERTALIDKLENLAASEAKQICKELLEHQRYEIPAVFFSCAFF